MGEVVKALRREMDLTQERLAERAGLHVTYISHIERGDRNLTWTALNRICKGLGVSRSVLIGRVDDLDQQ